MLLTPTMLLREKFLFVGHKEYASVKKTLWFKKIVEKTPIDTTTQEMDFRWLENVVCSGESKFEFLGSKRRFVRRTLSEWTSEDYIGKTI